MHRTAHIGAAVSVLDDKTFLILVIAISVAFASVLWPFVGGIFWATVLAIIFAPLHRWLTTRMGQRRTPAALATVVIILLMVISPAAVIAVSLVRESIGVYASIQSGELDFARMFDRVWAALPSWVTSALQALGLTDLGDLEGKLVPSSHRRGRRTLQLRRNSASCRGERHTRGRTVPRPKTPNYKQDKKRREDAQKKRNAEEQERQAARKRGSPAEASGR